MNVKLQHVIRAITGGERDSQKLARLRDRRIKADGRPLPSRYRVSGDDALVTWVAQFQHVIFGSF